MNEIVDWELIRSEYVSTNATFKELAEKYGMKHDYLRKKASRGKWKEDRDEFRRKRTQKAINKAINRGSEDICQYLLKLKGCSTELDLAIERVLQQRDKLTPQDVRLMASALKDAIWIKKQLYDIPTQAEREAQKIAVERLEIEKQRLEHELAKGTLDTDIEVVFTGEVEDWSQ